jgi:hypothetical protein
MPEKGELTVGKRKVAVSSLEKVLYPADDKEPKEVHREVPA